jgi:glycosyltransferase involved in cell wall biosynthesis
MTGSLKEKVDVLKACVIIPTYNNAATLAAVIEDVAQYSDHIIVVCH